MVKYDLTLALRLQKMNTRILRTQLFNRQIWQRLGIMALLFVLKYLVIGLLNILIIFQCFYLLIKGVPHLKTQFWSQQINQYLWQIVEFLTFNSNEPPFPFTAFMISRR